MKKDPFVDVIIPTFNGLPYLKQTVRSVLDQSYRNFNLYIVDDGSTDNGATEKYVSTLKDERVHYLKKANGGQATARNFGIQKSHAPYIAFLDSDDLWYKDKLKKQVALMESCPEYAMVYGWCRLIDERGTVRGNVKHSLQGRLFKHLLDGNKISGSASMVIVRRSVFNKVGLFREDFLIGEDWEMWLRIALYYPIGCVNQYLADLRVLPEGMQRSYLKMAYGLNYLLSVMLKEFNLNYYERARLKGTCLWDESEYYFLGREQSKSRRTLFKLLFTNPFKLRSPLKYSSFYVRTLFGSEGLRALRRLLSAGYRTRDAERLQILRESQEKYGR